MAPPEDKPDTDTELGSTLYAPMDAAVTEDASERRETGSVNFNSIFATEVQNNKYLLSGAEVDRGVV